MSILSSVDVSLCESAQRCQDELRDYQEGREAKDYQQEKPCGQTRSNDQPSRTSNEAVRSGGV